MKSPSIPQHIAIIMDGNGRWAKKRLLPRVAGHREGTKAVRRAIQFAVKNHISVLTLFALSVENFQHRPANELEQLLTLFLESLQRYTPELNDNNVRLRFIGDYSVLSEHLQGQLEQSVAATQGNTGLTLVIAINYSGQWDIVEAAKRLAKQVAAHDISPEQITAESFQSEVALADLPMPDLLIRTSGELRISNFMLWQLAYTELFFTDKYWPDFDEDLFQQALNFYNKRQRRFGKTSEQVENQHA